MLRWIRGFFFLSLLGLILASITFITTNPFSNKSSREIHIYSYSDFLDLEMVHRFEKETGIKVVSHFFNTNEELITKLSIDGGKGIDIMFPSDYACRILAKQDLIQNIDKSRLNFTHRIYPFLLRKGHDPNNDYSIPYAWEGYGFAIDPKQMSSSLTLADLFNTNYHKVNTPDPVELLSIAAQCLYGNVDKLSPDQEQEVMRLIKSNNDSLEAYADSRARNIVSSGIAPFTLLKTSQIDGLKMENESIEFILPKDIIFLSIESIVIGKQSEKLDDVYRFLNYIYKPENLALTVDQFPSYPACPDALEYTENHHETFYSTIDELAEREVDHRFFSYVTDQDQIRKLFIQTKV